MTYYPRNARVQRYISFPVVLARVWIDQIIIWFERDWFLTYKKVSFTCWRKKKNLEEKPGKASMYCKPKGTFCMGTREHRVLFLTFQALKLDTKKGQIWFDCGRSYKAGIIKPYPFLRVNLSKSTHSKMEQFLLHFNHYFDLGVF